MEYFKINSLWKRNGWYFDEAMKKDPQYQKDRQSFIIGDYATPEFANVKQWHVEEKVDGTNIRVMFKNGKVTFGGRTNKAHIPCHLLGYLQDTFNDSLMKEIFVKDRYAPYVILYGEGYGPKIQKTGHLYRDTPGFCLFDIFIDGWWLKRDDVKEIAHKLSVSWPPSLGIMTEREIVGLVNSKPQSYLSSKPQVMEGVVCRPEPLMLFRDGKPIIWKLKCKEF